VIDALHIGATGMQAQQTNVDTIANNLANVNSPGFKKSRVSFADLMVREAQLGAADGAGVLGAPAKMGSGVGISNVSKVFEAGDMRKTDSMLDVAIQGDGFLEVSMPDGSLAYTRGGTLKVNRDGQLATQSGYALKPGISIPDNAQQIVIGPDGRVQVRMPNQTGLVDAGTLDVVRFANAAGLSAQGDNMYRSSVASGEPVAGRAAEDGMGAIAQGFLEGSNVKMVDEMVNLMIAQRAYEANVKVVQASDDLLGMINGLRK
jgi:flagellar basal-body rod protein FlgG